MRRERVPRFSTDELRPMNLDTVTPLPVALIAPSTMPWLVVAALVATMAFASVLSWIATWHDKRRAERSQARIPERTLHLLELVGGWPGSLLARRRFRHKTRKLSFRAVSFLCAATHILVAALVLWWTATRG